MGDRVGILGGTFDPVHYGHLAAARGAAQVLKLDRLLLVPAGDPWQKGEAVRTPAEDRYAMTLLATAIDDTLDSSRLEIDREGPSYTVDTLRALAEIPEYADAELFFVTGATFVGVTRPGHELDVELPQGGGRIKLVTIPEVDISSTLIRRRLADGQQIDGLTTPEVISYIRKRGLYSGTAR